MKKIVLIIILALISFTEGKSQSFELGYGVGSGSTYLIENLDKGINIDYATPFSSHIDLKYYKPEKYFGIKLRLQYLNTGIKGRSWKGFSFDIDGEVTSLTTMILLEHLNSNKKWNLGYNFGIGYSNEKFKEDFNNGLYNVYSNYMSINFSGILNKKINENFSFQIEPSLLWTDPINSFRNRDKWQIAREDISLLIQLGITYKIN